jgi:aromatic-L-amino-acid/L-tryptophan decarboxylase
MRDLDWDATRAREMGDMALDVWGELLTSLRDRPVARRRTAAEVREAVVRAIPDEPLPAEEVVELLRQVVLEHATYPGHPRFLAYITGAGTIPGAVADLLASAANQNAGAWRLAPGVTELELALCRWFAAELGLPAGSGGILTSGSAMANLTGLKVARDALAGWDVRAEGLGGHPRLVVYTTGEAHSVIERAVDMLGLGSASLRRVGVDDSLRMRPQALRKAIAADRAAGRQPLAVVASAGTVTTGAIDPLAELAEVCAQERIWLHLDGAYGAPAAMAPDLRPLFAGIELADSIAFDCHKWLYVPVAVGCILVRDTARLAASFAVEAAYTQQDTELTGRGQDIRMLGPQFSRTSSALRVWASLLAHGRSAYVRRISHDAALARYLHARVVERPDFEPIAPQSLSITCFRYVPPELQDRAGAEAYLDELNRRLMTAIQLDGRVFCSNAVVRGRFGLRACIVNFRTEAPDLDALLDVAAELGARLHAGHDKPPES